ncbi:hypothetical protein TSAR_007258 [Trichomalopsis sarcophagae]|uniref:Uncharacterized protein n=1 Tax=Trichomalopsis sarcophagae TaxID=543379 RepID=A0A232EM18_9HYME|nr:hypothetical protein TSAR_007258 [Trichomalopsis sarcophagae]
MHTYFWILNSGKQLFFIFSTIFFYDHFLIFEKHYFAFVFFNHPIVTNDSAIMHLKKNKITYFSSFGARDRKIK